MEGVRIDLECNARRNHAGVREFGRWGRVRAGVPWRMSPRGTRERWDRHPRGGTAPTARTPVWAPEGTFHGFTPGRLAPAAPVPWWRLCLSPGRSLSPTRHEGAQGQRGQQRHRKGQRLQVLSPDTGTGCLLQRGYCRRTPLVVELTDRQRGRGHFTRRSRCRCMDRRHAAAMPVSWPLPVCPLRLSL